MIDILPFHWHHIPWLVRDSAVALHNGIVVQNDGEGNSARSFKNLTGFYYIVTRPGSGTQHCRPSSGAPVHGDPGPKKRTTRTRQQAWLRLTQSNTHPCHWFNLKLTMANASKVPRLLSPDQVGHSQLGTARRRYRDHFPEERQTVLVKRTQGLGSVFVPVLAMQRATFHIQ